MKPGFTTDISLINGSFFLSASAIVPAISKGGFLFIFDKTIPTLVERSQLNFSGGISVFIPSRLSGKVIKLSLDKSKRIFFILSKY